jgi:cbb3-type cytochrome oxidase subunit 3
VIGLWAWSARNRAGFEEAARLPLLDDDMPAKRVGASREDKA